MTNHSTGKEYALKAIGDAGPVVEAGGILIFAFARKARMIASTVADDVGSGGSFEQITFTDLRGAGGSKGSGVGFDVVEVVSSRGDGGGPRRREDGPDDDEGEAEDDSDGYLDDEAEGARDSLDPSISPNPSSFSTESISIELFLRAMRRRLGRQLRISVASAPSQRNVLMCLKFVNLVLLGPISVCSGVETSRRRSEVPRRQEDLRHQGIEEDEEGHTEEETSSGVDASIRSERVE
ncbi:uncharacterized protein A4U43_C04F32370 [Asparagus officinalis]|uniref:Uncharacterized protein n=1 Tax=Asparagus officinalis TaxID=4686 RepID=A0A5P1F9S4_ASPOF|nr:uncharacterized protein A4U43_C04F32370 [Asparagus officinalis]